jgi:hypothetical protein
VTEVQAVRGAVADFLARLTVPMPTATAGGVMLKGAGARLMRAIEKELTRARTPA